MQEKVIHTLREKNNDLFMIFPSTNLFVKLFTLKTSCCHLTHSKGNEGIDKYDCLI